ncbi:uncharacterized protein HD556DRAFT_1306346 [Suillus plorans]|uniref:Uncharacterized protein n=1 Tax=Suillus plorans TaxID=116603 RepID=A0A9P7DLC5_9AGAM|nr:uncharacterized protein HD556DRAFT_1306346 [Suillus plorans]KAG1797723.1 hypothetical protein HD556DRAFT_1306346 [Suillus plorans]
MTSKLTAVIFTSKLKGVNRDHSADQRKVFELIQRWKNDNWRDIRTTSHGICTFAHLQRLLVEQHGGLDMWNVLPLHEHDTHELLLKQDLAEKVRNRIVDGLPDYEWRAAEFLVRAGCCMHKDLNSVKGRNMTMMDSWELNGFKCPMLLANKDNAATLHQPSETGILSTFPDTSNTRYQSYCKAAAKLLTYLNEYIAFLEQVRDKKEKRNFSHIEENLYNALHNGPTLTELANVNILDLGPSHNEVMNHLKLIIENPHLLISSNASFELGALNEQEWQNPGAIEAVHKLAEEGKLPHLSEHDSAFMASTNDAIEGALGSYWLHACQKPLTSMHSHNAQAQFKRNETQAFIDATFTAVDHQYTMQKAHEWQSMGLEEVAVKRWRQTECTEKRTEKGAAEDARLDGIAMVVMSKSEFLMLLNTVLTDQANLHQQLDPLVPKRYTLKNKQALVSAIMESIARSTDSMSQTLE